MFKRKRTYVILVLLIVAGIGVYFEPTYHVRGWLHREAFFKDRPTSYWRTVVEHDLQHLNFLLSPVAYNEQSFWERTKNWLVSGSRSDSSFDLLCEDAAPVLRELTADSTPQIAGFCRDALSTCTDPGPNDAAGIWPDLTLKHNLRGISAQSLAPRSP